MRLFFWWKTHKWGETFHKRQNEMNKCLSVSNGKPTSSKWVLKPHKWMHCSHISWINWMLNGKCIQTNDERTIKQIMIIKCERVKISIFLYHIFIHIWSGWTFFISYLSRPYILLYWALVGYKNQQHILHLSYSSLNRSFTHWVVILFYIININCCQMKLVQMEDILIHFIAFLMSDAMKLCIKKIITNKLK